MTAGSGKPPADDELQSPASDAGWGEPRPTVIVAVEPAAAAKPAAVLPVVVAKPEAPPPGPAKPADGDGPLLPPVLDKAALRDAVGASTRSSAGVGPKDDDDDDRDDEPVRRPRNRKAIAAGVIGLVSVASVAALILVGRVNSERYLLACEAERAVPQRGRAFPPWGTRPLDGEAWAPLKIAAETPCQPHETDDELDLERRYLAMLLDQASALLTAREVAHIDDADALLKQALLLTRPAEHEPPKLAAERSERRDYVQRLLGDVTYWRAAAKLRDAATALADAAKQFDSAAAQHPQHVSDAAAWASYARKLAELLHAGPIGASAAAAPPSNSPAPAAAATVASSATAPAAAAPASTGSTSVTASKPAGAGSGSAAPTSTGSASSAAPAAPATGAPAPPAASAPVAPASAPAAPTISPPAAGSAAPPTKPPSGVLL